jgi:prepilin-type N-terminal cleavage/methylation domain-containing protein
MQSFPRKSLPGRQLTAFTLVEMLVVIAIISILMTAGSIGLSGMGGKGVTSGVATAESLFDEARTTAVSRNLRACVLVAKELDNKSAEDLKRIIVAFEEIETDTKKPEYGQPVNPSGANPKWMLSSRGTILPDQTFFSEKLSKQNHSGSSGMIEEISDSRLLDAAGKPLKARSPFKGDYYIYEFNSQGICKTPGASFVIGNGARNLNMSSSEQAPRVMASGKRDFGGFVIWRNGRTSVFRSPDQISQSLPGTGDEF